MYTSHSCREKKCGYVASRVKDARLSDRMRGVGDVLMGVGMAGIYPIFSFIHIYTVSCCAGTTELQPTAFCCTHPVSTHNRIPIDWMFLIIFFLVGIHPAIQSNSTAILCTFFRYQGRACSSCFLGTHTPNTRLSVKQYSFLLIGCDPTLWIAHYIKYSRSYAVTRHVIKGDRCGCIF